MHLRRLPALSALRAFEVAGRLGSFKAAAEELAVTPAAISQQVRALEEDLEIALFTRGARSITLTKEGRIFQARLSQIFLQLRDSVEGVRARTKTSLKIETSPPIAGKWLVPRMHRFIERYPDAQVNLSTSFALTNLQHGEPDILIRFTAHPPKDAFSVKLFGEIMLPLASPELIERLDLRKPEDINRAPLIHDDSLSEHPDMPSWADWFRKCGVAPRSTERGVHFTKSIDNALDAAVGGTGVVLGRLSLAWHDVVAGRLVSPFGPDIKLKLAYYLICARGCEDFPLIAAFINWAREESFCKLPFETSGPSA